MSVNVIVTSLESLSKPRAARVLEELFGFERERALVLVGDLPSRVIERTSATHAEIAASQLRDEGFSVVIADDAAEPATAQSSGEAAPQAETAPAAQPGAGVAAAGLATAGLATQQAGAANPRAVFDTQALRGIENDLSSFSLDGPADDPFGAPASEPFSTPQGPASSADPFADIDEGMFGRTGAGPQLQAAANTKPKASAPSKYDGFGDSVPQPAQGGGSLSKTGISAAEEALSSGFNIPPNVDKAFAVAASDRPSKAGSRGRGLFGARRGSTKRATRNGGMEQGGEVQLLEPQRASPLATALKFGVKAVVAAAVVGSVATGGKAMLKAREQAKNSEAATAQFMEVRKRGGHHSEPPPPLHPVLAIMPKGVRPAMAKVLRRRIANQYNVTVEWDNGPEDVQCLVFQTGKKSNRKNMAKLLQTGLPVKEPPNVHEQLEGHKEAIRAAENDPKLELSAMCLSLEEHDLLVDATDDAAEESGRGGLFEASDDAEKVAGAKGESARR